MSLSTGRGSKIPCLLSLSSERSSSIISLSSPQSHFATGIPNPFFPRFRISRGTFSLMVSFQMYFVLSRRSFNPSGIPVTNSTKRWSRKGTLTSRPWAMLALSTFARTPS